MNESGHQPERGPGRSETKGANGDSQPRPLSYAADGGDARVAWGPRGRTPRVENIFRRARRCPVGRGPARYVKVPRSLAWEG